MEFEFFQSENGLWYWRLRARNKNIVATGGEGYATKSNAKRAVKRLQASMHKAYIQD